MTKANPWCRYVEEGTEAFPTGTQVRCPSGLCIGRDYFKYVLPELVGTVVGGYVGANHKGEPEATVDVKWGLNLRVIHLESELEIDDSKICRACDGGGEVACLDCDGRGCGACRDYGRMRCAYCWATGRVSS